MDTLEIKKKKLLKGISFTKVDVIKPGFEHMGFVSPGPTPPTPTVSPPTPPTVTPGPFPGPSVFQQEEQQGQ